MPTTLEALEDLCLDEFDLPADHSDAPVAVWRRWRDAARAHTACIAQQSAEYLAAENQRPAKIRHLGLPTFFGYAMAEREWMDTAARLRTERGVPGHGYVAKTGRAHEAVCSEHPLFRRVAWTGQKVPLASIRRHNAEHHDNAAARVYEVAGRSPSTLLP